MSLVPRLAFMLLAISVAQLAQADILIGGYGNSTSPQPLARFSDDAHGDVAPVSLLGGPSTGLLTPVSGTYESSEGVIYIGDFYGKAVSVFPAYASGDVAPIRTLSPAILGQPRQPVVDAAHDELILVGSGCCIQTYARDASGTTGWPLRMLAWGGGSGSVTQLNNAQSTTYLSATDEVAVVDSDALPPYASKILVFNRSDNGNTAPKRVITGAATGLDSGLSGLAWDAASRRFFALVQRPLPDFNQTGHILVFDDQADGDVAPLREIAGVNTALDSTGGDEYLNGIALDWIHRRLLVSTSINSNAPRYPRLIVHDIDASGDAMPVHVVSGAQTGLTGALGTPIFVPADEIMVNGFD
ncbi:MAG: hypothetical protein ABIR10_14215 [Dokdonella sp.]